MGGRCASLVFFRLLRLSNILTFLQMMYAQNVRDGKWYPMDSFRVQSGGAGIRNTELSHQINALYQARKVNDILQHPLPASILEQLNSAGTIGNNGNINKKRRQQQQDTSGALLFFSSFCDFLLTLRFV